MDRSGLIIFAFGPEFTEFVVKDLIENSPAAIADFRSGDIITKIKGIDSKYYTLETFTQLLQGKSGKKIHIQLSRNNQLIRKELILRDLI